VFAVVSLQFFCAYALRNTPFLSWQTFLTAYVIGATANQNLFLAIHEISHNLAFKSPFANRMLAIFANLPIGIPYSASFRVRYGYVYLCACSLLTLILALPPDPPQVPRRRWARHRPPDLL